MSKIGTSCSGLFDMSGDLISHNLQETSFSHTAGIDIIALHTLGGTPFGVWHRSRPPSMLPRRPANPSDIPFSEPSTWPRDLLQPEFATVGARVLTYGYCTDPGRGSVKSSQLANGRVMHVLDIDYIAKDLLGHILEIRDSLPPYTLLEKQHEPRKLPRPLIFIVHGLGGLVLKKAILLCRTSAKGSSWKGILRAVAHIVFLSTPHNGSDQHLMKRWTEVIFASGVDVVIPGREWGAVTSEFQALGEEFNFSVANVVETDGVVSAFGSAILTITTDDVARLGWSDDREKTLIVEGRNQLSIADISSPQDPVYLFIRNSIREVIDHRGRLFLSDRLQ